MGLKIQIERVRSLKSKCAQSYDNLAKLQQVQRQVAEEIMMTQEDREGQQSMQADLVARREDLDLMFE